MSPYMYTHAAHIISQHTPHRIYLPSPGRLYAAKMTQLSAANGGKFAIQWIHMGYGAPCCAALRCAAHAPLYGTSG